MVRDAYTPPISGWEKYVTSAECPMRLPKDPDNLNGTHLDRAIALADKNQKVIDTYYGIWPQERLDPFYEKAFRLKELIEYFNTAGVL